MRWYLAALRKYAVFTGRSRRREYWAFTLINTLIGLVVLSLDLTVGRAGALSTLYCLATLLPSIAVSVRRLHDSGRSGWWLLLAFVPFFGGLALLVLMLLDSQPGTNQYGPNPKGRSSNAPPTVSSPTAADIRGDRPILGEERGWPLP